MVIRFWSAIYLLFFSINIYGQNKYQKDFNEFWTIINENYAYLDQQNIDWKKVKQIYEPQAEKITDKTGFIQFLETVLNELHNGHSSLNTNLKSSNHLIPSGQDIYVEQINNKFIITDIRKGFGAEQSGLRIGMEIQAFNGKPVETQLNKFLPKFTTNHDGKMVQYAIDMLFAGTHDTKREILVMENGVHKTYFPDNYKIPGFTSLLDTKILDTKTVRIKINNCLGNNSLIFVFDSTLDRYLDYKKLVLDLTETPGGGNTTVARAIMGRFINKTLPYQKHEFDEKLYETKRAWTEFVIPRRKQFKGKLIILVGHWTGSMGEGMAIGFDGLKRGKTVGTKMAGLIGAISNFQLTETKIGFQFPTERLYHINGKPREIYLPQKLTNNIEETYKDVMLNGL